MGVCGMRRNVVGSSGSPRFRKREEDKEERKNKRAC